MAERSRPALFSLPPHRGFADNLVEGILADHGADRMALARGTILLPNNRAGQAISDAFVRQAEGGLLLPRLVAIGDADLDERTGALLDPLGVETDIPPAIDPLHRRFILARMIQQRERRDAAEAMRLAGELARTLDQLTIEQVSPSQLREIDVGGLSSHWQTALAQLSIILDLWPAELKRLGMIDLADRRNRQLEAVARRWRAEAPAGFVIAAGINSTAPAIATLLKVVATLPRGEVVLAGLDMAMATEEWSSISGSEDVAPIETHPQFHLALLLKRMGFARAEVREYHPEKGLTPARSEMLSRAMAPPLFTQSWATLPEKSRTLKNVAALELATPFEEAQSIAIAMREAIEVPGRTAALVTPDRNLAQRVSALLERWKITADDSAGRPLSATPPGTLLLALATAAVDGFAPAPLLALLKHPLVKKGDARLGWLDQVRVLDLALRGPRPCAGLAGITTYLAQGDVRAAKLRKPAQEGWAEAHALLAPLERGFAAPAPRLADLVATLRETMTALGSERVWSGGDGRMLADLIAEVEALAVHGPEDIAQHALPTLLRQLLDEKSVRPPQGGHPRLFIWGLIEAQLQSSDLMILGGLNEGVWPALPAPDPWLAPAIRKQLSLPSLERRIGLAAHDLVGALGSPNALLTRACRDASAPTIASRFWLRLETMTGGLAPPPLRADMFAKALDHDPSGSHRVACPAPAPPADERPRKISVTDVDKLKADPFAFYAKAMLKVLPLDAVDADPGPAWRGNLIHDVLHDWARHDDYAPDRLTQRMEAAFNDGTLHPLIRALWLPRLLDAVQWIEAKVADGRAEGRVPVLAEETGAIDYAGVKLHGRADRVDRLPDGTLSIVDYKSGSPPSDKATKDGFAMQLGLIGLIAERGGFKTLSGTATGFEYWSLAKKNDAFGWVRSPTAGKGANKSDPDTFVAVTAAQFADAAGKWLTGNEPFTAKLHPDYARDDYDHLMRLEEWQGRRG